MPALFYVSSFLDLTQAASIWYGHFLNYAIFNCKFVGNATAMTQSLWPVPFHFLKVSFMLMVGCCNPSRLVITVFALIVIILHLPYILYHFFAVNLL